MQEMWVQPLIWEDFLEEEMATLSSILAWKIPWTEEPGRLHFMGLQRVGHNWATKKQQISSSILGEWPYQINKLLVSQQKTVMEYCIQE